MRMTRGLHVLGVTIATLVADLGARLASHAPGARFVHWFKVAQSLSDHPAPVDRDARVRREAGLPGSVHPGSPAGSIAALQTELRRRSPAPTTGQPGSAQPPVAPQPEPAAVGTAGISLDQPSTRLRTFRQRQGLSEIQYPNNWSSDARAQGYGLTIAPRGGSESISVRSTIDGRTPGRASPPAHRPDDGRGPAGPGLAGSARPGEGGSALKSEHPGLPRLVRAVLFAALGSSLFGGAGCVPQAPADTDVPVRTLVQSARDPDLRWPAFSDFRSELERLYERAAWQPLWLRGTRPTGAATQLIARLAAADSLGLDPADYDAEWLGRAAQEIVARDRTPAPDELARFDVGLSVAAVRFVSALHRGRVSPRVVHAELFIPHSFLAIEMAVDSLRDANQQGSILERLQPRLHHYQLLKNGLARFRVLARDTSLVPLPALPRIVKPGRRLLAASRLRHLLEATGDLDRTASPDAAAETLYSPDLVAGVRRFQARQGTEPDGVIGPATAARLNRPFEQRVRQIELALERFRWLPVSFPRPPIIVNIPAFRLYAFRGSTDHEDEMLAMDVVVGDAFDKHTPVFAADMMYLIFRPYWEVPVSIMRAELGPKALSDPEFLQREGMVLVSGESEQAPVLPPTPENLARIGTGLRVRQLPGPQNALGLVKFLLPNANDVYLHDTAAKGLFAKARRDFSHGCIRLGDPVALAAHVLRDQPGWTVERIHAAMDGEDNVRVNLSRPVPVCIIYSTAATNEIGDVYFYPDIYDLDKNLDQLLRKGYPYPR